MILEGVELCCGSSSKKHFRMDWKEVGRVFKLELCSNRASCFLHCSVSVRGVLGRWKTMESELGV